MPDLFTLIDFQSQRLSGADEPGWSDVGITFPASLDSPAADQPQVRIQHTPLEDGAYILALSATYNINAANNSAVGRFSLDGGSTWEQFSRESKDSTDRITIDYNFPIDFAAGVPIDVVLQLRKETDTNTMQVFFMNLWIQRVA